MNSVKVTETEYKTFTNLTIHDYHLLDNCGRGCENTAHFQLLECKDCSANPGTTCSNIDPFRDRDFTCWEYNVRRTNGNFGAVDECMTSSCVTSQMCSNPMGDRSFRDQINKIPSRNDKNMQKNGSNMTLNHEHKYWMFLVIVAPGAIILLIILVVTRLGTQS